MWFVKTKFDSLDAAAKNSKRCRVLNLLFVKKDFQNSGPLLASLTELREIYIQGDSSIYDDYDFTLPLELGQLAQLKTLSILNLPLTDWPGWIFKLQKLEYLMVRGTDIDHIPNEISSLTRLETLRIENCPLAKLPSELKNLRNLKHLGLSDTKLIEIDKKNLPLKLKSISLAGSALYRLTIKDFK